ncbi:uncharacterized protein [Miscanthus floridulus]|uniref:uncharacterized protein n=1 Tax=Miscanthus floridulus TaxID=154761 RepID=UPI0034581A21
MACCHQDRGCQACRDQARCRPPPRTATTPSSGGLGAELSREAPPHGIGSSGERERELEQEWGPVSGYRGILRTFISAFIASYEVSYQKEDSSLDMISSILCEVYDGEESLCMQFWDKDSFVDGPIRSVLHMLEKEYPFQISELIRFLSAVCHGTWPAHCVYNYLERMNGVTTIYTIPCVADGVGYGHQIESHHPVSIPGIEGITIPRGTHGYILKVLQEDTVLVRWEFPHSGVFFLLITLAQELHSCNYKEASDIMDLLYRMVSSNKDLCFALLHVDQSPAVQTSKNLGEIENHIRIDIAKIFCNSIFKYVRDVNNADILSKTLGLLAEMIKCAPYHVFDAAFECNIFTSQLNGPSSDWLLSGALARMLFAASEGNGDCSSLTSSGMHEGAPEAISGLWARPLMLVFAVLDFTIQDSYRSNYHGLKDIEDIQLVLCNGLDIIYHILSNYQR